MAVEPQEMRRYFQGRNPLSTGIIILSIFVLIIVSAVAIIYAIHFSGGLSDKQEIWAFFGDYFGGVLSVVLGFFSILIAFYVLLKTNQDKKFERIYRFVDEFRSDRMSSNLKLLWDFYEHVDFKRRRKPLPNSIRERTLVRRYRKHQKAMTEVYFARRSVSYYYLNLSLFLQHNRLDEKTIMALWPVSSLSTLETIIIPCEQAISGKQIPNKLRHFEYLIKRWKAFDQISNQ